MSQSPAMAAPGAHNLHAPSGFSQSRLAASFCSPTDTDQAARTSGSENVPLSCMPFSASHITRFLARGFHGT